MSLQGSKHFQAFPHCLLAWSFKALCYLSPHCAPHNAPPTHVPCPSTSPLLGLHIFIGSIALGSLLNIGNSIFSFIKRNSVISSESVELNKHISYSALSKAQKGK